MTNQVNTSGTDRMRRVNHHTSVSMPIYGLGVLGAAVYYIQHAATFWLGVLGILKALVWPAMLLYRVLEMLKM